MTAATDETRVARRSSALRGTGGRRRPGGALHHVARGGVVLALALAGVVAVIGLAACGGDEEAVSAAGPSLATSTAEGPVREVLVAFLDMLERAESDDLASVATARYVANHQRSADAPLDEIRLIDVTMLSTQDGTSTAQLRVYLDPGAEPGPWGTEASERTLFASLVRSDDGGWLIDDFGTGP